jgi:hypothetical protein
MVYPHCKIALVDLEPVIAESLGQAFALNYQPPIEIKKFNSVKDFAETRETYNLCISNELISKGNADYFYHYNTKQRHRMGIILDQLETLLLSHQRFDITYGDYYLNYDDSRLSFHDRDILLSERERELVFMLLKGTENGQTKQTLLTSIWGYAPDIDTHTLETHIYRLRQKIEDTPDKPTRLITTHDGYKFQ